jgi:hypothetical protein
MAKRGTRDLEKESLWRRRLEAHAGSGQSVRGWCRAHGVTETAFYWWRRELARRDSPQRPPAGRDTGRKSSPGRVTKKRSSFVPIRVVEDSAGGPDHPATANPDGDGRIEIVLTDGRCVRITGSVNGQTLATVLDVLERRAC